MIMKLEKQLYKLIMYVLINSNYSVSFNACILNLSTNFNSYIVGLTCITFLSTAYWALRTLLIHFIFLLDLPLYSGFA